MIGVVLVILVVIIAFIYFFIEFKRMRHKAFAIFLISIILFLFITSTVVLRGKDVDLKTVQGLFKAVKIYFSWLGSVLGNMKSITTNAIKMDWNGNQTG